MSADDLCMSWCSLGVLPANSIRFAPPLVISEEDLMKAVQIIGECLKDLDTVCLHAISCIDPVLTLTLLG